MGLFRDARFTGGAVINAVDIVLLNRDFFILHYYNQSFGICFIDGSDDRLPRSFLEDSKLYSGLQIPNLVPPAIRAECNTGSKRQKNDSIHLEETLRSSVYSICLTEKLVV